MNIYTKFYDFMAEIIRLLEDHTNEDFMQKEYRRMILDVLKATLIIVPSFSTGNFDFRQVMGNAGSMTVVSFGSTVVEQCIWKMRKKQF